MLGRPPSMPRNQRPPQGSHLSWSEDQRDKCPAGSQVETGLGPAQRHARLAYDPASPLLAGVHLVMSPQPDPDALSPHPPRAGSFMPSFILHTRSLRVSWELVTRGRPSCCALSCSSSAFGWSLAFLSWVSCPDEEGRLCGCRCCKHQGILQTKCLMLQNLAGPVSSSDHLSVHPPAHKLTHCPGQAPGPGHQ